MGLAVGVGVTCASVGDDTLRAPLAAAANGLAVDATTTYEVDFPAGVVRVRLDLSVENTVAPDRDGGGVRSTYFTGWQVGVHGDATALAGQAGDEPIAVSLELRRRRAPAPVDHVPGATSTTASVRTSS